MHHTLALTTAQARFEAARKLPSSPLNHPARNLHGHSFIATAYGLLTPREVPFPGAQSQVLAQRLSETVQRLNFRDLNELMCDPHDTALALWLMREIKLDSLDFVGIQSTRDHGVTLTIQSGNRVEGYTASPLSAHAFRLWRRYRFKAAHQLPHVTPGHKCGRMHGHGFQVVLQADTYGDVDYELLDKAWEHVRPELDMKCLNDVKGLENPTSENLSVWIWQRLKPIVPALSWVTVYETRSCGAQFDGEQHRIWKDFYIDSAIRLSQAPEGDPRRMVHGDTFLMRLHLSGKLDPVMGWTMDFGEVKAAFDPIFKELDHRPLFEREEFADGGAEAIARYALKHGQSVIKQLVRVDVMDSQGAGTILTQVMPGPTLPS